jgi:stage II sporulation protein D
MLFTIHYSLFTAYAETTIRVLLVDNMNPRVPDRGEKMERLGNATGDVFLSGQKYSGIIEVWKGEKGLYVVNEIPFEDYIKGVVVGEVGSNWDIEALKAQAVAARTYAFYHKFNNELHKMPFHLTSSMLHQVYIYKGDSISENIVKAVNETRGEILTFEGKPILAFYHSASVGMTEDPAEVFGRSLPYLKPVEATATLSPHYIWEKRISLSDIEKAANITGIKEIAINSRTVSNRVRDFKIITDNGKHYIPARELRMNLGWKELPSTLITNITNNGEKFVFEGRGFGHGVGMCQWTVLDMARAGMNYREILSRFYPGAVIQLYEDL